MWKFLCVLMAFWKSFRAILGDGGGKRLCGKAGRCISEKHIWFLEGYFCVICQDRAPVEERRACSGEADENSQMYLHTIPWTMCAYRAKVFSDVFFHKIHSTPEFLRKSEQWGSKGILENVTPARREKNPWEPSADQHWGSKGNPVTYILQNLTFGILVFRVMLSVWNLHWLFTN